MNIYGYIYVYNRASETLVVSDRSVGMYSGGAEVGFVYYNGTFGVRVTKISNGRKEDGAGSVGDRRAYLSRER